MRQRAHLVYKTVIHHLHNPAVDSVIKNVTRSDEANLLDIEIPLFTDIGLERRKRLTRHHADLKCPYNTLSVGDIDGSIAFRIKTFEFQTKRLHTLFLQTAHQFITQIQVSRRKIIQTFHQCIDIES